MIIKLGQIICFLIEVIGNYVLLSEFMKKMSFCLGKEGRSLSGCSLR